MAKIIEQGKLNTVTSTCRKRGRANVKRVQALNRQFRQHLKMTIIPTPQEPKKRYRKADEAKLQSECFVWLWNEHPETRGLFFAVINENERSGYETKKMQEISGSRRKMRGVIAGVSDSIGLIPRGRFHGVCAEAKTKTGVQSAAQKSWQALVEDNGYKYFVYRSLDEFKKEMYNYLNQ